MPKTAKPVEEYTDVLMSEIQRRAKLFVEDIVPEPTRGDYRVIESAMLIGASIAIDQQLKDEGKAKNLKNKNRIRT